MSFTQARFSISKCFLLPTFTLQWIHWEQLVVGIQMWHVILEIQIIIETSFLLFPLKSGPQVMIICSHACGRCARFYNSAWSAHCISTTYIKKKTVLFKFQIFTCHVFKTLSVCPSGLTPPSGKNCWEVISRQQEGLRGGGILISIVKVFGRSWRTMLTLFHTFTNEDSMSSNNVLQRVFSLSAHIISFNLRLHQTSSWLASLSLHQW